MPRPALSELQAVVAVAKQRSFRGAAIVLGVSASALSHAIAALEQRMGVRLFHRTTRSVALSEAGERFLARIAPALREIDAAIEDANAFRDSPTGSLRLNTSEGAARLLMPAILAFLARYPEVRLDIVTDGRLVDIVEEGFDAGIRLAELVPQDMVAIPCSAPLRFIVAGAPAYFARHGAPRTPADLRGHACIRSRYPQGGAVYRWEFAKRGQQQLIDVEGMLTLDNSALLIDAALAGVGLIWTHEASIAQHLAHGALVAALEDWCPRFPGLCLYYPGHRHVPAALRAFIEVLREHDAAHAFPATQ
ncbi:LysR family transcriptional regulator [Xanthomonas sp. SI]|uniref:LysR family transcriptional regulator n=1 Tax=Xanthomonas sp. SI TaxID=2724123 RepID=UPI00163ACBCC|nr:LysR family transcriptional regulator [Xanthomonas sp. SI]QNH13867.1 transcriptional regulator [Xanthomonas sp. SI]